MGKWDFAMRSWAWTTASFGYENWNGLSKENQRIGDAPYDLSIELRNYWVLSLKKRASEAARLKVKLVTINKSLPKFY